MRRCGETMPGSEIPPVHVAAFIGAQRLIGDYAQSVDNGSVDDVGQLFAPHGRLIVHGGAEYQGPQGVAEFLAGSRASRMTSGFRLRHHTSSVAIRVVDESSAIGRCYFLAIDVAAGPDHWGSYDDRMVCVDGSWFFAERRVVIEGANPLGWIGSGRGTVTL
jgi:SnoaL-like domain